MSVRLYAPVNHKDHLDHFHSTCAENSTFKSPFWRFWIRPVISGYMCKFMDGMFIHFKKHVLDSVWLLDYQKLIPTFFSEVKNSFWRSRKSGRVETWKRVRQTQSTSNWIRNMWYLAACPNVTYIFMLASTAPEPHFSYCVCPIFWILYAFYRSIHMDRQIDR